ncbi:MAG: polysaccharide pyruvyl transferase family protein [Naasia sp.]
MRLVVIGDVGVTEDMMHIGDEAMFEAMVTRFRERGARITGVSVAPEETAERYGIEAVQRIGFDLSGGRAAAEARLDAVVRAAASGAGPDPEPSPSGLLADDPAWGVIGAVREADGVAVAGGGNMASNWPMHIFERRALAGIAAALGVPFVVSGQTLGPVLDEDDRGLIREIGAIARRLGVRESASARLAGELGIGGDVLRQSVDDASFLVDAEPAPAEPYLLVSLSTHLGGRDRAAAVTALAHLLDDLARRTGAVVRFHAHWGSLTDGEIRGDSVLHEEVRRAMGSPSEVVTTGDSVSAARLARGAALLVTSRYHPAVFAVPAGVPTLGVCVDDYTRVKLTGALGNFDQDGVVSLDDVLDGSATGVAHSLWESRDNVRIRGCDASARQRVLADAWWDELHEALTS